MATVSKRLYGPAALTTSAATKITVPGSHQYIIRRIRVGNPGNGVARTFTMSIGADAAGTRLYDVVSVPPGGLDIWGPFTMEATEVLQALADNVALTLTIDGQDVS